MSISHNIDLGVDIGVHRQMRNMVGLCLGRVQGRHVILLNFFLRTRNHFVLFFAQENS